MQGQLIFEDTNSIVDYVFLNGEPLAQIHADTGAVYFYHNDHLDTPQRLSDGNQTIVWEATYDPFGEATVTNNQVENNLRFPGQYFDKETGLHYNWFRYYDPQIGRYITSDPIGLEGGLNTYGYALANPLKYTDFLGLEVLRCGRRAELPFPFNQFEHQWMKTDTVEAGMGAQAGVVPAQDGNYDLPFTPVEVVDHEDESKEPGASCDLIEDIDEECVNQAMEIGRDLGRFSPFNNCQAYVQQVIFMCKTNKRSTSRGTRFK